MCQRCSVEIFKNGILKIWKFESCQKKRSISQRNNFCLDRRLDVIKMATLPKLTGMCDVVTKIPLDFPRAGQVSRKVLERVNKENYLEISKEKGGEG